MIFPLGLANRRISKTQRPEGQGTGFLPVRGSRRREDAADGLVGAMSDSMSVMPWAPKCARAWS